MHMKSIDLVNLPNDFHRLQFRLLMSMFSKLEMRLAKEPWYFFSYSFVHHVQFHSYYSLTVDEIWANLAKKHINNIEIKSSFRTDNFSCFRSLVFVKYVIQTKEKIYYIYIYLRVCVYLRLFIFLIKTSFLCFSSDSMNLYDISYEDYYGPRFFFLLLLVPFELFIRLSCW